MLKKIFSKSYFTIGLGFFLVFSAAPFYVMLITMFKKSHDLFSPTNNPFWLNEGITFEHLDLLF
ncbi:MAG: Maltose/maltodextrin transporter, permease protein MalG, partial [Nitrospirae bacterium]|nr:Maltose/maltodextrin transporter, permease protein MalG [Nitrospirota bacterium]